MECDDVLAKAEEWRAEGEEVALATVVATRRSAPRPLGSKLAVTKSGRLFGSVSGGCVEADVAERAKAVLEGAQCEVVSYGIADDEAWSVGLPCGGEIDVFVEPFAGAPPIERGTSYVVVSGEKVSHRESIPVKAYVLTTGAVFGPKKDFSKIELDGLTLPQQAIGDALFATVKSDSFSVAEIVVKNLEVPGPATLPKNLQADVSLNAKGSLQAATVRGPEGFVAKIAPQDDGVSFEVTAAGFTVPIAPQTRTSQPSRARSTAVAAAVPAAVKRTSSSRCARSGGGRPSIGLARTSRMRTPRATTRGALAAAVIGAP